MEWPPWNVLERRLILPISRWSMRLFSLSKKNLSLQRWIKWLQFAPLASQVTKGRYMGEKRLCSISVQACGSRIFWLAFCLDLCWLWQTSLRRGVHFFPGVVEVSVKIGRWVFWKTTPEDGLVDGSGTNSAPHLHQTVGSLLSFLWLLLCVRVFHSFLKDDTLID